MLKIPKQSDFFSVNQIITDDEVVFIVPTLQRPYAWTKKEIEDLEKDVAKASKGGSGKLPMPPAGHLREITFLSEQAGEVSKGRPALRGNPALLQFVVRATIFIYPPPPHFHHCPPGGPMR